MTEPKLEIDQEWPTILSDMTSAKLVEGARAFLEALPEAAHSHLVDNDGVTALVEIVRDSSFDKQVAFFAGAELVFGTLGLALDTVPDARKWLDAEIRARLAVWRTAEIEVLASK